MQVKPYSEIYEIYQHLMKEVDYGDWSEYLLDIAAYYELEAKNALEFACGFGEIAELIQKEIPDVTISDLEPGFLKTNIKSNVKKVCCDMLNPSFKGTYDFIYMTFDSINYLMTMDELIKFFSNVRLLLSDNGILTFDASLKMNSINNIEYLNRTGTYNGIKFTQKSEFKEDEMKHYNYFSLKKGGKEFSEIHVQKVFDFIDYFYCIEEAGLIVTDCFGSFTFDNANEDCERAQFVVGRYY